MKNEKLIKEIPDSYNRLFGGDLAGFKFSREDEREIKSQFNLERKGEQIIYFYDTTFWCTKKRGLCITNLRIKFKEEDGSKEVFWNQIDDISYCKESSTIDFYGDNSLLAYMKFKHFCDIEWKTEEYKHLYGARFAYVLMWITDYNLDKNESKTQQAKELYYDLLKNKKYDDCIKSLKQWANKHSTVSLDIYFDLYLAHKLLGDAKTAKNICDEAIDYYKSQQYLGYTLHTNRYYEYMYYRCGVMEDFDICDNLAVRSDCLEIMNDAPIDLTDHDGETYKEKASKKFNEHETKYLETFLEQPYNKRKIFVAVKDYTDLSQEIVSVINIDNIPSDIQLPTGHPIANQIYIGHPYLKNKYLPFENYELEFVEDRVREFCYMAQSLGAEEIVIEAINSSANKSQRNSNKSINMDGSAKIYSGSSELSTSYSDRLVDEISKSISLNQRYAPSTNIKLPDNLVWYSNEPSWQRLYEQRIQGGLLQHEERIDLRKSRVINRTEMSSVAADVKALFASANVKYNGDLDEMFESQENVTLSIQVKFTPIEQCKAIAEPAKPVVEVLEANPQSTQSAIDENYTAEELEYMEELRECLADGISASDRRLLGRLCKHLGISEQRAAELEESLAATALSEDEQSYLDEYKFCLEDDNEVSARERKMLERVRISLGISIERAEEIENNFKQD